MHIHESSLLEELVDRVSRQRTHTEHRLECIRPRTQMRDRPQILKAVALLLQRIVRSGRALDLNLIRLDLERLLRLRRCHERTCHDDRCAHVQLRDFREVLHAVMVYNLKRLKV